MPEPGVWVRHRMWAVPHATAIGASANVVVLGIAERSRRPISFWTFARYGIPVTIVTIAISALYLWLRYFALA